MFQERPRFHVGDSVRIDHKTIPDHCEYGQVTNVGFWKIKVLIAELHRDNGDNGTEISYLPATRIIRKNDTGVHRLEGQLRVVK